MAVNDGDGNLVMAMADMGILTEHASPEQWESAVAAMAPKWLVVDGNWKSCDIRSWTQIGKQHDCRVAFEPVSVEKSRGLFCAQQTGVPRLGVFPYASVHVASPNFYELAAMFSAAKDNGYLDMGDWFDVIDSFAMRGARDRLVRQTSAELTDAGVPIQSVQLLPYIPTLLAKLGSQGVLTTILGRDDPLLRDRDADEFILTRAAANHPSIGGVYMRLFPAVEEVRDVVSVNGAGDTFLGVIVSGLAQGGRVEDLVDVAQKGAVLSLKCKESVSPSLGQLEGHITRAIRKRP